MRISKKVIITIGLFLFIGSFVGTVVLLTGCSGGGGNNSINGKKETLTLDDDLENVKPEETIKKISEALIDGNIPKIMKSIRQDSQDKYQLIFERLDDVSRKRLADTLSNAEKISETENFIIFKGTMTTPDGQIVESTFELVLEDGTWKLSGF